MSVSVIVPTFNRAGFISECLDSILHQTIQPDQILVVDDGSTDDTARILKQFSPRIDVLSQPNGGKAKALNLGLQHCRGEFIWIMDDDDLAEPDALKVLLTALSRAPDSAFAFGRHETFGTNSAAARWFVDAYQRVSTDDLFYSLFKKDFFIFQPSMLIRSSAYKETGEFDISLRRAQDYDMLLRLMIHHQGVYVDEVVFRQREHEDLNRNIFFDQPQSNRYARQSYYDNLVLQKLLALAPIDAYLPWSLRLNDIAPWLLDARLRRLNIMVQKGFWDAVERDAADLLGQPSSGSALGAEASRQIAKGLLNLPDWTRIPGLIRSITRSRAGTVAHDLRRWLHEVALRELTDGSLAQRPRRLFRTARRLAGVFTPTYGRRSRVTSTYAAN